MASTPNTFLWVFDVGNCGEAFEVNRWWKTESPRTEFRYKLTPFCPYCGSTDVTLIRKGELNLYQCNRRREQFNALTKTPLQGTKINLYTWFEANWYYQKEAYRNKIAYVSKKLGVTKKTVKRMFKVINQLNGIKPTYYYSFLWKVRRKYRRYMNVRARHNYNQGGFFFDESKFWSDYNNSLNEDDDFAPYN